MPDSISAFFGADVSDVEAKMMSGSRAVRDYGKAVREAGNQKMGGGLAESLEHNNRQLRKGMELLKGGAAAAGVHEVIDAMKSFSEHAKQMGDKATEAQKSAALWGEEFEDFSNSIKDWGASALGTLAGWGRSIASIFSDPADMAFDDIEEKSRHAADAMQESLKKMQAAAAKAEAEMPGLQKGLDAAKRERELAQMDDFNRALAKRGDIEKQIAELDAHPDQSKAKVERDAERLRLQTELVKVGQEQDAAEKRMSDEEKKTFADQKKAADEAVAKKKEQIAEMEKAAAFDKLSDADKLKSLEAEKAGYEKAGAADLDARLKVLAIDEKIKEVNKQIADEGERLRQMQQEREERYMSLEQKIAQAIKDGREAQAAADKDHSTQNLIALEEARKKYLDLIDQQKNLNKEKQNGANISLAPGGGSGGYTGLETGARKLNEKGQLVQNGAVVSKEDAARADKTFQENAALAARGAKMTGDLARDTDKGADKNLLKASTDYLKSIDASLKPSAAAK